MKTTLNIIMVVLMAGWYNNGFAQVYEWQLSPNYNEEYVGMVTDDIHAGSIFYATGGATFANGQKINDHRETKTDVELYEGLLRRARALYGYNIMLRDFRSTSTETRYDYPESSQYRYERRYKISATVVKPKTSNTPSSSNTDVDEDNTDVDEDEALLSKALDRALQDIREGSRIAIDQIKVPSGTNKTEYKDEVLEMLIDKGYKVVAKEYLEKLYEEQQAQQSGIYNTKTTVKENNFSAVGYYLNVRLTEASLRVQIINVSTGEYDANVTIKL